MASEETQVTRLNLIWIGWVGVATIFVLLLAISPVKTAYVEFFLANFFWLPFAVIGISYMVKRTTDISTFPMGDEDTDTYPLQKYLGYNAAIAIAIVGGILFSAYIAGEVISTQELFLPVNPIFVTGVRSAQVFAEDVASIFTGTGGFFSGLAAAIPASTLEDSIAVFGAMLLSLGVRFGAETLIGLDRQHSWPVGFVSFVLIYPFMFSFVFHAFAYGAVDAAFNRVFIFGLIGGSLTMATGFIFPIVAGHITNNFLAATLNIIGKGQLVVEQMIPIGAGIMLVLGAWYLVEGKRFLNITNQTWGMKL